MRKGHFITAVQYWMDEAKGIIGSYHPEDRQDYKEDVEALQKALLKVLRSLPAETFKDFPELNTKY